ncbi:MAG: hypothetical protein C0392_16090 [Syntrophus sp. (in: bacteria)]|nr:hypothetical protein [Syntrophus sp. (in: bacteria)]
MVEEQILLYYILSRTRAIRVKKLHFPLLNKESGNIGSDTNAKHKKTITTEGGRVAKVREMAAKIMREKHCMSLITHMKHLYNVEQPY